MSRASRALLTVALACVLLAGCSQNADVTRDELDVVVERDAVAFTGADIPGSVLDRLAANRVVVLGETHHLRAHWMFVAALVRELHAHGFRQLLVEAPHMADWLFDDYVTGGRLEPDFELPAFYSRQLEAIRAFNDTLPVEDRVHVRAIDVNEDHHGGAEAFRDLLALASGHLEGTEAIEAFLQSGYATHAAETEAIETLRVSLETNRAALVTAWGSDWYERIVEMVEVERASIDIRSDRKDDDERAVNAREDVIKRLVDARIGGSPFATLINIGGTHAQKARLLGTQTEWLGDYLVHRSTVVDGGVFVLAVVSARTELEPGASGTPFDVLTASPENELFRAIAEGWPGQDVFLALDDPMFLDRTVAVNFEETIHVATLKKHYDAVVQYGLAHRMPSD